MSKKRIINWMLTAIFLVSIVGIAGAKVSFKNPTINTKEIQKIEVQELCPNPVYFRIRGGPAECSGVVTGIQLPIEDPTPSCELDEAFQCFYTDGNGNASCVIRWLDSDYDGENYEFTIIIDVLPFHEGGVRARLDPIEIPLEGATYIYIYFWDCSEYTFEVRDTPIEEE
jgi:hypothetical protein